MQKQVTIQQLYFNGDLLRTFKRHLNRLILSCLNLFQHSQPALSRTPPSQIPHAQKTIKTPKEMTFFFQPSYSTGLRPYAPREEVTRSELTPKVPGSNSFLLPPTLFPSSHFVSRPTELILRQVSRELSALTESMSNTFA